MIQVGILGCSDIARRKMIPALLKCDQARLTAVASRHLNNAAALILATDLSVPLVSYQDLINDPKIDLIYISLPNHLHEKWSVRALEKGKHVICEKPLGLSVSSVKRMLDTAQKYNRLLYENLMYLHHPQHMAVSSIVKSGSIGRILSFTSEFSFPGPVAGDFRLNSTMGGGAFNDMNRYPLSAAQFFLKGKTHHFIQGSIEKQDGLTLSFQAESITDASEAFSFLVSFGRPYRSYYKISGEKGSIRVERAYTTPEDMENRIILTIEDLYESIKVPPYDHFLGSIEHVCCLIHKGSWNEEHVRSMRLAELAAMFRDNCIVRGIDRENG